MIHPSTELRFVNQSIGYGVFAKTDLPIGTILYVQDALEITIPAGDPRLADRNYRPIIDIFATIESDGSRLLSWDIAKHVNHSCRSNTLGTAYGVEIAVASIKAGEQITDDYGMFNLAFKLVCDCGEEQCRGEIHAGDFDRLVPGWDERLILAFAHLEEVHQPLLPFLGDPDRRELEEYLHHDAAYRSTAFLKYDKSVQSAAGSTA